MTNECHRLSSSSVRIAFLTNKTAIASMPIYERLASSEDVDLAHTFFYDTVSEGRSSPLRIISQIGVRRTIAKVIEATTSSLRCKLGKFFSASSIRATSPYELAVIGELPHSTISDVNQPETVEFLRALNVDVVLVCVCKNILRREILASPNVAFVNVHPSLLPQYRGPTPTFWMLYHGESETGVTFHLMTPRIDDGEILYQLSLPLDRSKPEVQIETGVFKHAATVVVEVLRNLTPKLAQPMSHREGREPSYYTFPTQAQRRELKHRLATPKRNCNDRENR